MTGGPEGEGTPRDLFRVMMHLLILSWDLLQEKGLFNDDESWDKGDGGSSASNLETNDSNKRKSSSRTLAC